MSATLLSVHDGSGSHGGLTALLVHGGLDRPYTDAHPLAVFTRTVLECDETYAITLPLHGKAPLSTDEDRVIESLATESLATQVQTWVQAVAAVLLPVMERKNVIVFAFSLGALSCVRALDALQGRAASVTVVCVGSALGLTTDLVQGISSFWTLEQWAPRIPALQRVHHPAKIEPLIGLAHRFFSCADSPLLPDPELRQRLYAGLGGTRVFFINGVDDIPFPPHPTVSDIALRDDAPSAWREGHTAAIDCGHFDYYTSGWEHATRPALERIARHCGWHPAQSKL